jgi:hypothetical protein
MRKRFCQMGLALVLLWMTGGAWGGVRSIADVAGPGDLEKTVPISLASGWVVRVGLADAAPDRPWRLLYCRSDYAGKGAPPAIHHDSVKGEVLGPVQLEVAWNHPQRTVADKLKRLGPIPTPHLYLYCVPIALAWKGECTIRLWGADGALLARRVLTVEQAPTWYWQEFARLRRSGPDQKQDCIVSDQVHAAAPVGFAAVEAEAMTPEHAPLSLSLDNGAFHLRGDKPLTDWPDYCLLARWWVNDKPVEPQRSDRQRLISLGRGVASARDLYIAFGLPDDLGPLKAGDHIALQVLYAPGGYTWIVKSTPHSPWPLLQAQFEGSAPHPAPLLSNRLEFVLTAEQLRQADHPREQP